MSEIKNTYVCYYCEHETDYANDVMPTEKGYGFECVSKAACERRQKRTAILAEMQEMAKKPHVHPVDKFSRTSIAICASFMTFVITIGLAYLWFGV
jgi:hypothetical protein